MYRYETHLHTWPVSYCAHADVRACLEFYKALDYDGVFITNHFLDGNINIYHGTPYEEKIAFYFSDYEQALPMGRELGIKVFCGVELSYGGSDFLIYGLDKDWFLAHPEIMTMSKKEELELMMAEGALVIHAHPFREAHYIDHIRLYPRSVHGVEVVNASRSDFQNEMARIYADQYGLLPFAGSDNHVGSGQKKLAGICCAEPICSVADLIEKFHNRQTEIFTRTLE